MTNSLVTAVVVYARAGAMWQESENYLQVGESASGLAVQLGSTAHLRGNLSAQFADRIVFIGGTAVARTHLVDSRQTGLPPEFARLPMRMVRAELARLTDLGLLHRVATGFYKAVPDSQVGTEWMPGWRQRWPVSLSRLTVPMTPS